MKMDFTWYVDDLKNLNAYIGNDPINSIDGLGLSKKTNDQLVNAAEAVWVAAQNACPGSEFAAVLNVFNGCNSLGIVNAWAQTQLKNCIITKSNGADDPACKAWQNKVDILTKTWNQLCR